MKKKVFMIFALLVCVVSKMLGSPVDRTEAVMKAKEFMQEKGIDVSKDMRLVQSSTVQNHASSISVPAYYVFDIGEDNGFVIVSGDDRCYPILGYSDEGSFTEGEMPENMAFMLEQYAEQIASLREAVPANLQQDYNEYPSVSHVARVVKSAISPMLMSKWGQRTPFNNTCPIAIAGTGEHCVAGCTAVGMAQLLYYYKNRNVNTLQDNIDSYSTSSMTISGTAKGTKLDWSNMLDTYSGTETDAQNKAVADLIYYCGTSLKSVYRLNTTTGSFSSIGASLVKYFGYYPGNHLVKRTSYSSTDWQDMLYNELANKRPVLYSGSSNSAGHVFIIDGYDGDEFYHVNWGWQGNKNGFFHLSVVKGDDEESLIVKSDGWTIDQAMYVGIQPLNGLTIEDTTPVLSSRITAYNAVTYSLTTRMYNYTSYDGKFSYGYAVKGKDGSLTIVGSTYNDVEIENLGYKAFTYKLNTNDLKEAGLKKGSYYLVPVSKAAGENFWRECVRVNNLTGTHLSFDYNPSSTAISNVVMHPVVALKVTKIEAVGSCLANVDQPVHVLVENIGEDDFNDRLFLLASQSAYSFGTYKDAVGLYLAPGEQIEVELYFTPTKSGTWYVAASTNYTGATNLGYTAVTISSGSTVRNLSVGEITINNQGEKLGNNFYQVYGNSITGKVKLTNLDTSCPYAGTIGVVLRQQNTETSTEFSAESHRHALIVRPNESVDLDIDFFELNPNVYRYKIVFWYADVNQGLKNDPYSKFVLLPGVNYYDGDGNLKAIAPSSPFEVAEEALAVDFTGVTGTNGVNKVVPNSNPNTLYILGKNDVEPTGLNGKNVVKGGAINTLSLTEGFGFTSPITFTAQDVKFEITPTIAASGTGGWFTLALPFAATKVMDGNKQIDWFHGSSDNGKNFWLKEFVGMKGNSASFDYVDEMKAYTPYIMAVPGANYGAKWNLVGKKLVFSGQNQEIVSGAKIMATSDVYIFSGTTTKTTVDNVWGLNSKGTRFNYGTFEIDPFEAYFKLRTGVSNAPESFVITNPDGSEEDGIMMPVMMDDGKVSVYNLSGLKVAEVQMTNGRVDLGDLPQGIYIINGQKFIK